MKKLILLVLLLASCDTQDVTRIPSKPNLDTQCDEYRLNDKKKTVIKVCQDWDQGSGPVELLYNPNTKRYSLEIK